MRRVENLQCPAYQPTVMAYDPHMDTTLLAGIYSRADIDYPRYLIMTPPTDAEQLAANAEGWCAVPKVDLYVSRRTTYRKRIELICDQTYDFVLSPDGSVVPEDPHPTTQKLRAVSDGYIIQNVTGIRTRVVTRMDGKGYDITKRTRFVPVLLLVTPHVIHSGPV